VALGDEAAHPSEGSLSHATTPISDGGLRIGNDGRMRLFHELIAFAPVERARQLVRAGWRENLRRVGAYIRSAPLTYVYLFTLLVTTWTLQTANSSFDRKLLLEESTNLHRLAHNPVRVLVASAFWLPSARQLLLWVVLFSLVLAPVERWIGAARTAAVFALGHVGATLATAAGLWLAVDLDLAEHRVVHSVDVGVSYGFFAVVATLAYRLQGRRRFLYIASVAGVLVAAVFLDSSFTDFGHLAALAIGLATAPLFIRDRARHG
jgi:hypothetical protein